MGLERREKAVERNRGRVFLLGCWAALCFELPCVLYGQALSGPETPIQECIRSLPANFLLDPSRAWVPKVSSETLREVAQAYRKFRRCLQVSGRGPEGLPVPRPFDEAIQDEGGGPWPLYDFYRTCGHSGEKTSVGTCKKLVKSTLEPYLDPGADWDQLCFDWCRAFHRADPDACDRAVHFLHPELVVHPPYVAMCRRFSGLDRSVCESLAADEKTECRAHAYAVEALRRGSAEGCPEALRWRCEAALDREGRVCAERHELEVAWEVCRIQGSAR